MSSTAEGKAGSGAGAVVVPAPRGRNPFSVDGIEVDERGVRGYAGRPESLVEMLRESVGAYPDAVAIVEIGGPSLTYRELWKQAARVAGGLRDQGVARGDRVGIRLPNGIDWVLAFWGTLLGGAVAVPINTRFANEEVAFVLEDSGVAFCFEPRVGLPEGESFVIDGLGSGHLAAIFYTSGTTGFPKGAMMTHRNFLTNSENVVRMLGVEREEGSELSTLISVPMFHVTGCNSQLIPLLELGGRVEILGRGLDLEAFLGAINDHGINLIITVPAIYQALLRHPGFAEVDRASARWALFGGAPMAAELVRAIQTGFPNARVGNGFGLTETSSMVSFLPHGETERHVESVGFAMPSVDLALAEPDPESGVGELLVRGANVISGYWERSHETTEAFVGPWLRTGDLVRVDEAGLLYVVDRVKDMINRGGENVYSVEVENAIASAPGVAEAAAIGVPDDMMGEKVGAVVVSITGADIDVDTVIEHARKHLADFKVPQYLVIRSEPLPRNPGGKVLKKELRAEVDWGAPLR